MNEAIRARGTLTVRPQSDIDSASGYPCFEGYVIDLSIDGIDEVFVTKRFQLSHAYTKDWEIEAVKKGLEHADRLKKKWLSLGIELTIQDSITDALKVKKASLEAELREIEAKLGAE